MSLSSLSPVNFLRPEECGVGSHIFSLSHMRFWAYQIQDVNTKRALDELAESR